MKGTLLLMFVVITFAQDADNKGWLANVVNTSKRSSVLTYSTYLGLLNCNTNVSCSALYDADNKILCTTIYKLDCKGSLDKSPIRKRGR